ncbi:MAG: winged helix-turn-helix domain-containing protein [Caldisphaera sp.]
MAEQKKNRSRVKIYLDILETIEIEEKVRLTRIMYSANLPYDRLLKYIDELKEKGFINEINDNDNRFFILTDRGKEFIKELKKVESFLRGFGLSL